jgi:cell division protease FtsH
MVYDYAMGSPAASQSAVHQGPAGEHSEQFRRVRDEEQQALAFEAQRAALELISGQRGKLDELAQALLEHEVLEREDIDRIMHGVPRMERRAGVAGLRMVAAALNEHADDEDPKHPQHGRHPHSAPPPVPGV